MKINYQTITSREIAKFTKIHHQYVLKAIKRMLAGNEIEAKARPYQHPQNYQFYTEYLLPSDSATKVIAYLTKPKQLSPYKRKRVAYQVRDYVFDRDGHNCNNCGSSERLGLDHIIPVSRGGSNEPSNLQVLCQHCNSQKGTKTMEEWQGEEA